MSSILEGYTYDIFISYRQKDNKYNGWVTEFVDNLKRELEATFKEDISVYFDENPHDGLLDTHIVDKSLQDKLKCLVFIPIISRTYCDPKSFAWQHEFLAFRDQAKNDDIGLNIKLANGNVASRILPLQIHELGSSDLQLFEKENGGPLRAVSFIYKSPGVNRPLIPSDSRNENMFRVVYRDQINKTANAISQILSSLHNQHGGIPDHHIPVTDESRESWHGPGLWQELKRRNVVRAGFAYIVTALVLRQMMMILTGHGLLPDGIFRYIDLVLAGGLPLALILAWFYKKKPMTGNRTILVLSAVVILQFLYFYVFGGKFSSHKGENLESVAVLPFENLSEARDDEYFADGLTDEIIEHLSILGDLHVISRQSVYDYRGRDLSYKKIADELNVANILTGSVRRSGDVIRITARLIECSTSKFLWGETFQRTGKDIMAVQSEIARSIATVLNIRINTLEKKQLERVPTRNPTSYDYYIKGRTLYYQYQRESNDSAIGQFKMAIALDPDYALAWAGLGDAYSQMHNRFGMEVSWLDSSISASQKCIALDSSVSDGYKALANAYTYSGRYDTAFVLLKKAISLNPNSAQAIGNLGTCYFLLGNLPEALQWEKKAAGLNPKNAIPFQITGWIYLLLGDLKNAQPWLEKSLQLNSVAYWDTYELLGYCYVLEGRKEETLKLVNDMLKKIKPDARMYEIAGLMSHFAGDTKNAQIYFQRSIEHNTAYNNDPLTVSPIGLGQILLESGRQVEADLYLTHALEINLNEIKKGSQDKNPPFHIAAIYAIRGNREQALYWLQKAIDANWIDYAQLKNGPWFIRYRKDPEVIARIELLSKKAGEMRKKAEKM